MCSAGTPWRSADARALAYTARVKTFMGRGRGPGDGLSVAVSVAECRRAVIMPAWLAHAFHRTRHAWRDQRHDHVRLHVTRARLCHRTRQGWGRVAARSGKPAGGYPRAQSVAF